MFIGFFKENQKCSDFICGTMGIVFRVSQQVGYPEGRYPERPPAFWAVCLPAECRTGGSS